MHTTQHRAGTAIEHAEPFEIHAAGSMVEDLRDRLARTRWIESLGADGWTYGFDLDYLRALVRYWRDGTFSALCVRHRSAGRLPPHHEVVVYKRGNYFPMRGEALIAARGTARPSTTPAPAARHT